MNKTFNRQSNRFGSGSKIKAKSSKNSSKGLPTSKDIELATKAFLAKGGEIEKYSQNSENAHRDVFRANVEPDSRLGMGSLVDDSWDCWEKKDYETNPSGSVSWFEKKSVLSKIRNPLSGKFYEKAGFRDKF